LTLPIEQYLLALKRVYLPHSSHPFWSLWNRSTTFVDREQILKKIRALANLISSKTDIGMFTYNAWCVRLRQWATTRDSAVGAYNIISHYVLCRRSRIYATCSIGSARDMTWPCLVGHVFTAISDRRRSRQQ